MKNFVVVRIANKQDGTAAVPVSVFETENEARREFYRLCGQAVDSEHPMDAVSLLSREGFALEHKAFPHAAAAPAAEGV